MDDGRRAAPPFRVRATHLSARRPSEGQGTHCAARVAVDTKHHMETGVSFHTSYWLGRKAGFRTITGKSVCELSNYEELPVKYAQMLIRV